MAIPAVTANGTTTTHANVLEQINTNFGLVVEKETGKGLSEEDFTTILKAAYDAAVTQVAAIQLLLQSDDLSLDQLQEIVTYIKANKALIDSITTDKLNTSTYTAFLAQYETDLGLKMNKAPLYKPVTGAYEITDADNNYYVFLSGTATVTKNVTAATLVHLIQVDTGVHTLDFAITDVGGNTGNKIDMDNHAMTIIALPSGSSYRVGAGTV